MATYNAQRETENKRQSTEQHDPQQSQRHEAQVRSSTREGTGAATERERGVSTTRESGRPTGSRGTSLGRQQRGVPGYGSYASPFTTVRRMMEDMDRLFEHASLGHLLEADPLLGLPLATAFVPANAEQGLVSQPGTALEGRRAWAPQLEVFERDNALVIRADLPGMKKDDISLDVNDGVLTISGERKSEFEDQREGFYRSERSYGRFSRSLALPEGVDGDQAHATFNDGVLEVTLALPKREEKRRRIQIR